jgi:hypothetical protein
LGAGWDLDADGGSEVKTQAEMLIGGFKNMVRIIVTCGSSLRVLISHGI